MKLTDTELDAILAETHANLDALLATAEKLFPSPQVEYIDIEAEIAALGLSDIEDIDDILAKPSTPALPVAPTPPPPIPTTGTVKISVRIPARTLAAFKARAAERRVPYQRLVNQVLSDAVTTWEATAGKPVHV